ncbi:MAG: MBL fold metallo-hydrolase [Patescibacteria group bacterium]|jgi:L-ascorbate metabolism protein UlaG (beta-lactamase superfamily)|nr:MBL fold metallo-hydrolase [Patescibacteria group bacterium]
MHITWLKHSCFKFQDKTGSEGTTLITDPFDSKYVGLKMPTLEADILTISHEHEDHSNKAAIKGNPYIMDSAGEYDVKGVSILGVDSFHDEKKGAERGKNVIFRFEMDGIVVTHLGDLGHVLDNKQLQGLVGTDILLIPVGGRYTLDAKKAVEVISQIEPRIVIPMHYKVKGMSANFKDIDGVDKFIKEIGIKPTYEEKVRINKKDLPQDEMELIIMEKE